jgi:hypothetical protein
VSPPRQRIQSYKRMVPETRLHSNFGASCVQCTYTMQPSRTVPGNGSLENLKLIGASGTERRHRASAKLSLAMFLEESSKVLKFSLIYTQHVLSISAPSGYTHASIPIPLPMLAGGAAVCA